MSHFVISIEGAWDRHCNFFQRFFAQCLAVSALKVSNDLDKYLPRQYFKDCLESDVRHMTLILSKTAHF